MCGWENSKRLHADSPANAELAAVHKNHAAAQDRNEVIVNLAAQNRMLTGILSESAREHIGP
jgi:hypothetical protein